MSAHALLRLAEAIDGVRSARAAEDAAQVEGELGRALAVLVVTAFPAFGAWLPRHAALFDEIATEGYTAPRERAGLVASLAAEVDASLDVGRALRTFLRRERLRLAVRELLPSRLGGAPIDVTAREMSDIAEAAIEVALAHASDEAARRYGAPRKASGADSSFVVLGMGKLGGQELNVGSDVDLVYVYDSDDGATEHPVSLHEHWSFVARRLTSLLDEVTDEGPGLRVDLRLRPEGGSGPLVNSAGATIRYHESFGRPWERAAWLRARPVAGDLALGEGLLEELAPFVYPKRVDPSIAAELFRLAARAREELSSAPSRDLKLGEGGIREAEFFVQALCLVWGGQRPEIRRRGTLDALARLYGASLVQDRELREIADGYLLLRKLEHRVQWSTLAQTHLLPDDPAELLRLARTIELDSAAELIALVDKVRSRVRSHLYGVVPEGARRTSPSGEISHRLAEGDLDGARAKIEELLEVGHAQEIAKDLAILARRPDLPLGRLGVERFPELGEWLVGEVLGSADPELAARGLRSVFARLSAPLAYASLLAEQRARVRRLAGVLGASALVSESVVASQELAERVLVPRPPPDREHVRWEIEAERALVVDEGDVEEVVGAVRRGKRRAVLDVALADLAGEVELGRVGELLSEIADAVLGDAVAVAGAGDGLAVLGLGRLGGRDLGYGSDLDLVFLFDPGCAPPSRDPHEHFARVAQRVVRLLSMPHRDGAGYDVDARLRPSGTQGMLVTSLGAFARYHGLTGERPMAAAAGAWERQALLRSRFVAGDARVAGEAAELIDRAVFAAGPPDPSDVHRMRLRMEQELGKERPGRYNLKTGRGGLVDVEFAVQWAQLGHGIREPDTLRALARLSAAGHIDPDDATVLRGGYEFLRRVEQRVQIVHRSSSHLLEESAPGLLVLARRLGFRSDGRRPAHEVLLDRYREVTSAIRAAYLRVLGVA